MARHLHQRTSIKVPFIVVLTLCIFETVYCQRAVPGVNPQHYQQAPQQQQYQQHQPPPPQYQQQQQHVNQQQQHVNQQHVNQQQMHMAPGVNPQQYQQQQQHQQNVQYQQVPVQQQQQQPQQHQQIHQGQPQQQQQQQQHHQQQQQHQQQPHGHHGQPQQVLHAGNMDQERAHIQEHMQVPIDTSKMSEAELQFHYFKMHDSDNNNKLDGCELIKSLIHWHADEKNPKNPKDGGTGEREGKIYTDQGLTDVIDYVLKTMDFNGDGYVDYAEYRKSEDGQTKGSKN